MVLRSAVPNSFCRSLISSAHGTQLPAKTIETACQEVNAGTTKLVFIHNLGTAIDENGGGAHSVGAKVATERDPPSKLHLHKSVP